MTTTETKTAISNLLARRSSCLGVDLGSHNIKMAQMESVAGRWMVTNRLVLPLAEPSHPEQQLTDGLLTSTLDRLQSRPLGYRQTCSCVLPMSAVDIRSVEVPKGSPAEIDQMATEALRDAMPNFDDRIVRLWRHSITPHDMALVSGISIHSEAAEQIVDDLGDTGLNCHQMESLPFALARASTLTADYRPDECVGILDWGHRTVTFVIAHGGRPEFVRNFRDCSGKSAVTALADGLNITTDEALAALATTGLPKRHTTQQPSAIARAVEQLLTPSLQNVADELHRTLMYLRHHAGRIVPKSLSLVGGMATVGNISEFVQEHCGLETRTWSLNASNPTPNDPVFAAALAASIREVV